MHRFWLYFFYAVVFVALSSCSNTLWKSAEPVTETANPPIEKTTPGNTAEHNSDKNMVVEETEISPAIVLAAKPSDLLTELASKFTWQTNTDNNKVASEIRKHQKTPKHFYDILKRSEPFLAFIKENLEEEGLPLELALLPFIESGFDPSIFSPSGAAGLWQFMPSTAKYLGMHTDWWYDERLDIVISTEKAMEYLTYLNNRFNGDWELALAAYNGGEGHVSSRMKRASGDKDYWSLKLKTETSSYVPKLLAVIELVAHPEKYGMHLPEIDRENQLVSLEFEKQIDLRLAAEKTGMSYARFKVLNAGYLRWISPPTKDKSLLIPEKSVQRLTTSLEDITSDEQIAWNHYRVQRGDTLIEIASEFGTTLRALIAVNQLKDSRIYIHQDLLIPVSELPLTRLASQSNSVKQLYIVRRGDSLWDISRSQGVTISQIRRLNNLTGDKIKLGQVLVLAETFTGEEITYLVKRGDSLSLIASRFQVAISDIRIWNALKGDLIQPGQELRIRPENES